MGDRAAGHDSMRQLYSGLAGRLRPGRVSTPGRRRLALFGLANGTLSIAIVALAAAVVDEPLVFPSLGPTAYLLSVAPTARTTEPRNIVVGHLLGVVGGVAALVLFGLTDAGSAFAEGMNLRRSGAAAVSLGLTAALMIWLDADHAPAGATTLIVSLGILTTPSQLAALMVAVVFLAYQGVAVNRAAGIEVPLWHRGADPTA